ncbi:MAG: arsenate reductase ArsC [Pseudomonadota bacterium]
MTYSILVLCTGNSARSILGEALFQRYGAKRVAAYSAGSHPKGVAHPGALRLLKGKGIDTSQFRSKSWDEFSGENAPVIDLVITVCGNADGEVCPVWAGTPLRAHWGLPDPADVNESETAIDAAFADTWRRLENRVAAFMALPFETLDRNALKAKLDAIGAMQGII